MSDLSSAAPEAERLRVIILDGARQRVGFLNRPVSITGTTRHMGADVWTIQVPADDPLADDLQREGARVILQRGTLGSGVWETVSSGKVISGNGPLRLNAGYLSVSVRGDWRLFENILAWPAPYQPIAPTTLTPSTAALGQAVYPLGPSQGTEAGTVAGQWGYYYWPVGLDNRDAQTTVEGAVKALIRENLVDRVGLPVTIAPDLGRGGTVSAAFAAGVMSHGTIRMDPIGEAVADLLAWANLGLRAIQLDAGQNITIDVYELGQMVQPISVDSGLVDDGTYGIAEPTATRIIVGGAGDLAARVFTQTIDAAREALHADVIEVFKDATGGNAVWPDGLAEKYKVPKYHGIRSDVTPQAKADQAAYLAAAARKGLDEGAATTSLSATLSPSLPLGTGASDLRLGDLVSVRVGHPSKGNIITDRIREVEWSWTRANGLVITPVLGERSDDPDLELGRAIRALATSSRRLATDK